MDDDEDEREFSRSIVFGFFTQAEETFVKMDDALWVLHVFVIHEIDADPSSFIYRKVKDLANLSSLGHFLKGSSATLGLTKVKDSCAKIQHFGQKKDEAGTKDVPDEALCLERIAETLKDVKEEYAEVEKVLKIFYGSWDFAIMIGSWRTFSCEGLSYDEQ
jgi:osomolarity two-component system, phosphorelay intermediate protein YPD1